MTHAMWWKARWPLVCEHPSTAPAVLLAAKLLVLYPLSRIAAQGFSAPFLPFWEWLEAPSIAVIWACGLTGLFWAGACSVLFNVAPRLGMASVGAALTLDIFASRLRFSNSELLMGLLLIVFSLTERADRYRWLLRGQLALVYGGAALNKLLSAAWRDGRYFEHWAGEVLGLEWFSRLDAHMMGGASWFLGWFTIIAEFALAVLALRPGGTFWFVVLGLGFHVGILVFSVGAISWIFLFLMTVAFLALADLSKTPRWMQPWWPYVALGVCWLVSISKQVITGG
jgi:hypothetical protein